VLAVSAKIWFGAVSSLSAFGIGYAVSLLSPAPPDGVGAFVLGHAPDRSGAPPS